MKKITAVLFGLSLTLATAGLSFAAQTPATPANKTTATKKHMKHHKKAGKAETPAPAEKK